MAIPQCYRCRVRSLDCRYQAALGSGRTLSSNSNSLSQEDLSFTAGNQDLYTNPSIYAALDNQSVGDGGEMDHTFLPPFPDYNLDWQEAMTNIENFSVPDQLHVNDAPSRSVLAGDIYQHRIVYAIKRLKSFPELLVIRGQIPFIHKILLESHTTKPLLEMMSLCALYGRKSEANQVLVYNTIHQYACDLVEVVEKTGYSGFDFLASVQAMVLLQIIRFFDGDIRQRADAERLQPLFIHCIRRLQQQMQDVEGPEQIMTASNRIHTSNAWESWLYAESLRRTVIMGYSLQGLYSFIKNGWDDSHHDFEKLSFFGQKALWYASSRFEWELAVAKHRALPIRFCTWDSDIATAEPGEMEELGIIMMALIKGVDECCHWIGNRLVHEYGLIDH